MEPNKAAGTADLWYVDNYILLKDYYDRTISRIAARCVRKGNIAIEDYPFFGYILDVLEEISETGEYILQHRELYPYVERKIAGGLNGLKKTLIEYQNELKSNSTPDMIKEDAREVEKMKQALGDVDKSADPTVGAGMVLKEQPVTSKRGSGLLMPLRVRLKAFMLYGRAVIISCVFQLTLQRSGVSRSSELAPFGVRIMLGSCRLMREAAESGSASTGSGSGAGVLQPASMPAHRRQTVIFLKL